MLNAQDRQLPKLNAYQLTLLQSLRAEFPTAVRSRSRSR